MRQDKEERESIDTAGCAMLTAAATIFAGLLLLGLYRLITVIAHLT